MRVHAPNFLNVLRLYKYFGKAKIQIFAIISELVLVVLKLFFSGKAIRKTKTLPGVCQKMIKLISNQYGCGRKIFLGGTTASVR